MPMVRPPVGRLDGHWVGKPTDVDGETRGAEHALSSLRRSLQRPSMTPEGFVSLGQHRKAIMNVMQLNMLRRCHEDRFELKQRLRVAEDRTRQLAEYVREAAGDESVLVPVASLEAVGARAEQAERERDALFACVVALLSASDGRVLGWRRTARASGCEADSASEENAPSAEASLGPS